MHFDETIWIHHHSALRQWFIVARRFCLRNFISDYYLHCKQRVLRLTSRLPFTFSPPFSDRPTPLTLNYTNDMAEMKSELRRFSQDPYTCMHVNVFVHRAIMDFPITSIFFIPLKWAKANHDLLGISAAAATANASKKSIVCILCAGWHCCIEHPMLKSTIKHWKFRNVHCAMPSTVKLINCFCEVAAWAVNENVCACACDFVQRLRNSMHICFV